jgi:hypothetical protein
VTYLADRGSSVAMQCARKSCSVGCGFFFNPKEEAKYRPARASLIFSHASAVPKLADISHCESGAVELGLLTVPGGDHKYQPRAIPAPSVRQEARCCSMLSMGEASLRSFATDFGMQANLSQALYTVTYPPPCTRAGVVGSGGACRNGR